MPLWVTIVLGWYAVASLAAFVANVADKRRAVRAQRRISERTLHTLELLGGWPGALLAQHLVRHKTAKASYRLVLWAIVALHALVWLGVAWLVYFSPSGGASSR